MIISYFKEIKLCNIQVPSKGEQLKNVSLVLGTFFSHHSPVLHALSVIIFSNLLNPFGIDTTDMFFIIIYWILKKYSFIVFHTTLLKTLSVLLFQIWIHTPVRWLSYKKSGQDYQLLPLVCENYSMPWNVYLRMNVCVYLFISCETVR